VVELILAEVHPLPPFGKQDDLVVVPEFKYGVLYVVES
jgi:hypothetical protein